MERVKTRKGIVYVHIEDRNGLYKLVGVKNGVGVIESKHNIFTVLLNKLILAGGDWNTNEEREWLRKQIAKRTIRGYEEANMERINNYGR